MFNIILWVIFVLGSAGILWFSWASLKAPGSHGFPRAFAFLADLALVLLNLKNWFFQPFSPLHILSWVFLLASLYLAVHGFFLLRVIGMPHGDIEATTRLVMVGAYRFIRHPLYSSLLFLGWGAFLKSPQMLSTLLVLVVTLALWFTARAEERENLEKFGEEYRAYMHRTRRFIPFLF